MKLLLFIVFAAIIDFGNARIHHLVLNVGNFVYISINKFQNYIQI